MLIDPTPSTASAEDDRLQEPVALWDLRPGDVVVLVANTSWYLFNFRGALVRSLVAKGIKVVAVSPRDEYVARLEALGARWLEWNVQRDGMRPWRESLAVGRLVGIYRRERPAVVNHFTVKAVLYGSAAAKLAGVRCVVNNVTGLGHIFLDRSPKTRLVRKVLQPWYSWALSARGSQTILQNGEDLAELASWVPSLRARALLTNGSGVDLRRFSPHAQTVRQPTERLCVAFIGRLLREKGAEEFVAAAKCCRESGVPARFVMCGTADPGNPSAVDEETLAAWRSSECVELLGHVDPIEDLLSECDLVVLPSYREGTPKALLEAAAMGKPVVATDVPGCRDAVDHGVTGLLVPARDVRLLADAIRLLADDAALRSRMGAAGREMACRKFDDREVVATQWRAYSNSRREHLMSQPLEPAVKLDRGVFLFSLDFELAWGTRGRPNAKNAPPFLDGTRAAIRHMLSLFEAYDIRATWAMVGALLLSGNGEGKRHRWLTSDRFDDVPPGDCRSQPHWYAEDVVEWLLAAKPRQELACHTLTHLFLDAGPEGRAPFQQELASFLELFAERGFPRPRTFIFPKAYMGHFDVLAEAGFECYRGPEPNWFESLPGALPSAACRLIDAKLAAAPYVGLPRRMPVGLWQLPSSQFYSPFLGVGKRVSVAARVKKAIKGVRQAAERRRVFHLWTHPFNMGLRTDELMSGLEEILAEVARHRDAGRLDVKCMDELSHSLLS